MFGGKALIKILKTVENCKKCSFFQNNPNLVLLHYWEPTNLSNSYGDFVGSFMDHT